MGIRAIKSIETPNGHIFSYQNMVHIKQEESVEDEYEFIQKIGEGSFAEVFKAKSILTGNIRAIKKVRKSNSPSERSLLLNEFDILKRMDHTNILKMYEIFEEEDFFYIVTELCAGKELFDCIVEVKRFQESEACQIFFEIVSAVMTLHDHKIMHRDLKPENIMYSKSMKTLKLIDFGSAIPFEDSAPIHRKRIGTSYYIAPQVLKRVYNEKCDIWSLGVILYILLCGQPPFKGSDDTEILKSVLYEELNFENPVWKKVSEKAKQLLRKMVNKDLKARISAVEVLNDEWVKQYLPAKVFSKREEKSISKYLGNMKLFQEIEANQIQEGLLIFIINFVKSDSDQAEMMKAFKALDLNRDGVISLHELKLGMGRYLKLGEREALYVAKKIFEKVDLNNSGSIDYSEFLLSASSIELLISEENIDIAFDYIDTDRSGCLSVQEIREKLGSNLSEETYAQLLKEFDKNQDGEISRDEFRNMMKNVLKTRRSPKK